jgi:hypothetical protein
MMSFSFLCFSVILIARDKYREKENVTKMPNNKRAIQITTDNRKYTSANNDPEKEDEEQSTPTPSSPSLLTMKQVTSQCGWIGLGRTGMGLLQSGWTTC